MGEILSITFGLCLTEEVYGDGTLTRGVIAMN